MTDALLKIYKLPKASAPADDWRDIYARIVADCQVHATIRGFTSSLLAPPAGHKALPLNRVHRYKICWRAAALDAWLNPAAKLCHTSDKPIWWQLGRRAEYTPAAIQKVKTFLEPFWLFLRDQEVDWGTNNMTEIREFGSDGNVRIVQDLYWDRGMEIWSTMWTAQSQQ